MGLIELILVIAIIGVLTWLILQLPMPQPFKNIIIAVVAIFVILWLLQNLGMIGNIRLK